VGGGAGVDPGPGGGVDGAGTPGADCGTGPVPTATTFETGSRTISSETTVRSASTPLMRVTSNVTFRTPGLPSTRTTSVPWGSHDSRTTWTGNGISWVSATSRVSTLGAVDGCSPGRTPAERGAVIPGPSG